MSFDLRIHFSGLMMWVPEDDRTMHVLMPSTAGHVHGPVPPSGGGTGGTGGNGGGVHGHEHDGSHTAPVDSDNGAGKSGNGASHETDTGLVTDGTDGSGTAAPVTNRVKGVLNAIANAPHFARIVYDVAYEKPNQTQLSRRYKMVDLSGRVLDLTGLVTTEDFCACLPDEIPALDHVAQPVPRELIQKPSDSRLAGRVMMNAGALARYELGALFNFGDSDDPQRMTFETEWAVRGIAHRAPSANGTTAYLPGPALLGPDTAQAVRMPNLFPIGQTIHLMVYNTIAPELPPHNARFDVKADGQDAHFAAYFGICKPSRNGLVTPVAIKNGPLVDVEGGLPPDGAQIPSFICVQAQGKLG